MKTRNKIFDSFAEEYDSFRPKYPIAFVEKIACFLNLTAQSKILEIGCGTGQATRTFGELGLNIKAIDPGEELIVLGKKSLSDIPTISFDCCRFEDFENNDGQYDYIFAASSFHWIAPEIGWKKVHQLLTLDGHFSTMTISREMNSDLRDELDAIYLNYRSAFAKVDNTNPIPNPLPEGIAHSEKYFSSACKISHEFDIEYTTDSYLGLLLTMSDHRLLPKEIQTAFFNELAKVCDRHGRFKIKNVASAKFYRKIL